MKRFQNEYITFFLLFVLLNPILLIKIFKIKIIADSYLLTILCGLFSIFFLLIILGKNKKLRKFIKIIFVPYFIIFLLFIIFTISELITANILTRNDLNNSYMSQNFIKLFRSDRYNGYKLNKNFNGMVGKFLDQDTIFYSYYETDSLNRRNIFGNSKNDNNHLIFFGCSYTFGDGVDNKNTFPQIIKNTINEKYSVYNYGVPGYGTQQMLSTLQYGEIKDEINQRKGIAIYVYVPGIIARNIGAYSTFNWSKKYPCYIMKDDSLYYFESTDEAFPIRSKLFKLMHHFNTFKYLNYHRNIDYPPVSEKDIELTTKMILKSKDIYISKFPESKFYTLIFPHLHGIDSNTNLVIESLANKNISVLDLSCFADTIPNNTIPVDGHPSKLVHKEIAAEILKLLKFSNDSPLLIK